MRRLVSYGEAGGQLGLVGPWQRCRFAPWGVVGPRLGCRLDPLAGGVWLGLLPAVEHVGVVVQGRPV